MAGKALAAAVVAAGLALAVGGGAAWAHKVNVFAYAEDGALAGQGYFPGGGACQGCRVELVGPDGGVLARARTDGQGEFRLPLPEAGPPLTVRLYASMGHAAEYRLPGAEPGGAGLEKEAPGPGVAEAAGATTGGEGEGPGLSRAELRREVRSAVEEALAPVRRRLARQEQRRVTAQDVIGGVGYIVGLLGVALYLKSRKGT